MIIDVRGANGSGKSYMMHQLLKRNKHVKIFGPTKDRDGKKLHDRRQLGYRFPKFNAVLLGRYDNVCGGCDGINSPQEVVRLVRKFSKNYSSVLLEGILVAHTYQRYADLAVELKDFDYQFWFLKTSLSRCVNRVKERRRKAGTKRPLRVEGIHEEYAKVESVIRKVKLNNLTHRFIKSGDVRLIEEELLSVQ